ncbi:MAG: glycosyltransferase [Candidatus Bathyarchaeota archaeon]|jgi:GT2 family glycosyltransferase|nr:glycosyltransferase [Candidatus Bathyarchaeota archaeon]
MSFKKYSVSILIRTRDVESFFKQLLLKLAGQTLQPCEVVVVDNFSSMEKLEEMRKLLSLAKKDFFDNNIGFKLVPIRDKEFSHPYSTNVGVFLADSDLICITNGHSSPSSDMWLENGVYHFGDLKVAGVGGYFTPHEDGTLWEKLVYYSWKKLNEISKAYVRDNFFSTIDCILRKSLWEEYPFDEKIPNQIPYAGKFGGEDYDWAIEMQARGYKIIVEPKFSLYHSHKEKLEQLLPKYLIWRQIRKKIRRLKRPRKSYTKLWRTKPIYYNI